jgi:hypothetical protein
MGEVPRTRRADREVFAAEPCITTAELEGSSPTPTSTTGKALAAVMLENGFTAFRADDYLYFGVTFRNPNPSEWLASGVGIQIDFYDQGGSLLDTTDEFVTTLLPGQTSAIGDVSFDAADARTMEVQVLQGDWESIDFDAGDLTFSDVQTRRQRFGGLRTTGRVSSSFTGQQESVQITVIYRDAQGQITGGDYTYIDIPALGNASFEVEPLANLDFESTEVYYQL